MVEGACQRRCAGCASRWLRTPEGVAVRHSVTPEDGAILYTRDEFRAFLDGAKKGEFDHLV